MHLLHGFDNPGAYRGGFVAIGNFDGVHRGHQSMVAVLVERARDKGVPAVVLTFNPHPLHLLRPEQAPPSLSTVEWKAELLEKCGVDCVIAYQTDLELMRLLPDEFFERVICNEFDACGVVEGPNFFFGRGRAGDISTLERLCGAANLSLDIVPPIKVGERFVSSSVIRARISEGRIAEAVDLLGHGYVVQGMVSRGAMRGRELGFPTANIEHVPTLLPKDGVYAAACRVGESIYPAAVNLGANPTFGEEHRKFEVHLIGFTGDLYGRSLGVEFISRVRNTRRFADAGELQLQMQQDIEQVRRIVENERLG